jgi:hypothetical protein
LKTDIAKTEFKPHYPIVQIFVYPEPRTNYFDVSLASKENSAEDWRIDCSL